MKKSISIICASAIIACSANVFAAQNNNHRVTIDNQTGSILQGGSDALHLGWWKGFSIKNSGITHGGDYVLHTGLNTVEINDLQTPEMTLSFETTGWLDNNGQCSGLAVNAQPLTFFLGEGTNLHMTIKSLPNHNIVITKCNIS